VKKRGTGRKCSLGVPTGAFSRDGIAGSNQFLWNSQVNGRTLKAGTYRLIAVASSGLESSPLATASFTVARVR
jgi:hypothetical protein